MAPTKGIVEETTIKPRLGTALDRATGTPFAPSAGRVANVDRALERAREVLGRVDAFYSADVLKYRDARCEAGFDLLGPDR